MKLKGQHKSYEEWAESVQKYELDYALKQLAAGADVNTVMEAMSYRIQKKLLHPIILAIKESHQIEYDPVKAREDYFKQFGDAPRPADHVTED